MWVMVDQPGETGGGASGSRHRAGTLGEAVKFSELLENCARSSIEENSRYLAAAGNDPYRPLTGKVETSSMISRKDVSAIYLANRFPGKADSGWEKYKDDQLLKNPGGDFYDLKRGEILPPERRSFAQRLAKNFSDAAGNIKNFAANLFGGAERSYRDENNRISRTRERGFISSVFDGIKNIGRAFSFGALRRPDEPAPEGFLGRTGYFLSNLRHAVFGDLFQGAAGSVVRMAENLLLAGWNLLETVPDATIGNFRKGEELTTRVFDNGQVAIGYLMDILPAGEGWVRVHATDLSDRENLGLPVFTNLRKPEREDGDRRWKYVRNTRFRKIVETVGSLGMDVLVLKLLGESKPVSEERRDGK